MRARLGIGGQERTGWDLWLFLLLGRLGSGKGGGVLRGFCPFQWTVCFGEGLPEKIQDAELI